MSYYQNTFYSNLWNDQALPENFNWNLFEKLNKIYPLAMALKLFQEYEQIRHENKFYFSVVKLYATTLNKELLENMKSMMDGQSEKKAIFYSGHDTNLFLRLVYHNLTSAECLSKVFFGEVVQDCLDSVKNKKLILYHCSILITPAAQFMNFTNKKMEIITQSFNIMEIIMQFVEITRQDVQQRSLNKQLRIRLKMLKKDVVFRKKKNK